MLPKQRSRTDSALLHVFLGYLNGFGRLRLGLLPSWDFDRQHTIVVASLKYFRIRIIGQTESPFAGLEGKLLSGISLIAFGSFLLFFGTDAKHILIQFDFKIFFA